MTIWIKYIFYLIKSRNLHGIHSPFVYKLVKDVIYDKKNVCPHFEKIENLRRQLNKNNSELSGVDLGAGKFKIKGSKTIGRFSRSSSKSAKYAGLLYRLANWRKPHYALELGTALGISAMYQASAFAQKALFISLEGNPHLAERAGLNFRNLNFNSIKIIGGNFDDTLPMTLNSIPRLDWVFFDGNHKKEPTLRYFKQCLEKASENAIFIFDDINWSAEMREAWIEIKKHKRVSLTIDLFFLGLVFFDKKEQKEHFTIRF